MEALEQLAVNQFDVIYIPTDIQMPEIDGLTLSWRIRGLSNPKKSRHARILAITGNVVKEDLESYMAAGIDGYVLETFQRS